MQIFVNWNNIFINNEQFSKHKFKHSLLYVNKQYFNINFQNFNTCRNYNKNKTKCLEIIVCNLINLLYKLTEENRFSEGKWRWFGMRKPVALLCRRVRYYTRILFWYRHTTWLQSRKFNFNFNQIIFFK